MKSLYAKKEVNLNSQQVQAFFNVEGFPQLSEDQQQLCEGLLTVNECFKVLNTCQNNESPGNEGLTTEFYKTVWHLFGNTLVGSLNKGYQIGELSNSQWQRAISKAKTR